MSLFGSLRSKRLAPRPVPSVDDQLRLVATALGHGVSEWADMFGGYKCACQRSSWSHLPEFGPYGGCSEGWADARAALAALSRAGLLVGGESGVQ